MWGLSLKHKLFMLALFSFVAPSASVLLQKSNHGLWSHKYSWSGFLILWSSSFYSYEVQFTKSARNYGCKFWGHFSIWFTTEHPFGLPKEICAIVHIQYPKYYWIRVPCPFKVSGRAKTILLLGLLIIFNQLKQHLVFNSFTWVFAATTKICTISDNLCAHMCVCVDLLELWLISGIQRSIPFGKTITLEGELCDITYLLSFLPSLHFQSQNWEP